ncbi:MAG: hypothetical protein ACREOI_16350 [bacterium]
MKHLFIFPLILLACSKNDQAPVKKVSQEQILQLVTFSLQKIEWNADSLLTADFNGDNVTDYAIFGQGEKRLYIAVVIGPFSKQSRVVTINFGFSGNNQDDLCAGDYKLALESLDYDPVEVLGQELPGFKRSQKSQGITVGGDMCDKIHLFWNHTRNELGWWRL